MNSTLVLQNQFGETSNNFIKGGSGQVSALFTVNAADAAGNGITGLLPKGIAAIFMHTSQTPAAGNPNPAAGYILVKFAKGYAGMLSHAFSLKSPLSGSSINVTTGVTGGLVYIITALGTTTAAQWQALGLPTNVVPAVGQSFVAPATVTGSGTGTIQVQANTGTGVLHLENVGDASLNANTSDGTGGTMILAVYAATSSSVTTLKPTAPADGSGIGLTFQMTAQPSALE